MPWLSPTFFPPRPTKWSRSAHSYKLAWVGMGMSTILLSIGQTLVALDWHVHMMYLIKWLSVDIFYIIVLCMYMHIFKERKYPGFVNSASVSSIWACFKPLKECCSLISLFPSVECIVTIAQAPPSPKRHLSSFWLHVKESVIFPHRVIVLFIWFIGSCTSMPLTITIRSPTWSATLLNQTPRSSKEWISIPTGPLTDLLCQL